MKAKQPAVKKYTTTQIKMLVERMVDEGKQRVHAAQRKANEAFVKRRQAAVEATFVAHGFTPAEARVLFNAMTFPYCYGSEDRPVNKLLNVPKEPKAVSSDDVYRLGEKFKFDLTMADAGDYEKHMKAFAAAVDKLLK